jgi:Holliday junction resolvasome RuvABC endonuclease subunit
MARLAWIENWLDKTCLIPHPPDYAGVEDYAIRVEQGAHYMGEVGGIIRILLWFRGIPFRLSDPISVKMFATHDGTAQKDLVEECVKERWGVDFSEFNPPAHKKTGKVNRTTSEDLCDAYSVAMLTWTEYRLRTGQITTADLGHEKEIRVFNRVTKTYPTSLLGREWIQNPGGSKTPHGGLRERIESKIKALEGKAPGAAKMLKELLQDG